MEEIAPLDGAADFDNPGLLVGRHDGTVTGILTALDLTTEVLREAKEKRCEMVVMHHPIMFKAIKKVTDDTEEGRAILFAAENGIAVYAAHTNLDFADGGLNDFFLQKLGLTPTGAMLENEGRRAEANMTASELLTRISDVLGLGVIRTTLKGGEYIKTIDLCTGSGKSLISAAESDCYITGELGHHDIYALLEKGVNYIELSHYDSESMVMELLKNRLSERFKGISVFESLKNTNPMRVILFK